MSAYSLKNIVDQVITQLKNIDEDSGYNFTMNDDYIKKDFYMIEQAPGLPFICVASAGMTGSTHIDQVTDEIPIRIELMSYVKKEGAAFDDGMDLALDIEKAIRADEEIGSNNVYDLSITHTVTTLEDFGIVETIITCKTEYTKT